MRQLLQTFRLRVRLNSSRSRSFIDHLICRSLMCCYASWLPRKNFFPEWRRRHSGACITKMRSTRHYRHEIDTSGLPSCARPPAMGADPGASRQPRPRRLQATPVPALPGVQLGHHSRNGPSGDRPSSWDIDPMRQVAVGVLPSSWSRASPRWARRLAPHAAETVRAARERDAPPDAARLNPAL